jgi:hypothetical protein
LFLIYKKKPVLESNLRPKAERFGVRYFQYQTKGWRVILFHVKTVEGSTLFGTTKIIIEKQP